MSKRLFLAGCVVLVATGLVHLLGHYAIATSTGDTDADRQLLAMMRGDAQDMGLGFVRTTMDLLLGFSLTFSVLPAGMGMLGFVLLRHVPASPRLLRDALVVYASVYGVMTVVAWRYWFPAPLFFLGAAFACFASGWLAGESGRPGRP